MTKPAYAVFMLALLMFAAWAPPVLGQSQTRWEPLDSIPDEVGFAGGFAGVTGDALLFAGGANFAPPVFDNDKVWHDRVFVLPKPDGEWIEAGTLPRPLAYGMSVTYEGEVICIGGDDADQAYTDVFALSWDGSALTTRTLPALPEPVAYGGAALIGSTVYVAGGQTGKTIQTATNYLYAMDLAADEPAWERLPDMPDEAGVRAHNFVVAQHDGKADMLYVFGGRHHDPEGVLELGFLSDCWEYDPSTKEWQQRADSPVPLMAGSAVAFGQSHVFVTSYADGSALTAMIDSGVPASEYDHPGFSRPLYTYHTITDAWAQVGQLPEGTMNQVTTTAVKWGDLIIVPSGEVHPRVRSPKVWSVSIEPHERAFGAVNFAVLVIYLLAMVGVGVFFVFKNKNTDDYFRGGKNIPWWVAGCSIFATMLSSITYMAIPAKAFATDFVYMIGNFMIFAIAPIAVFVALPFFRRIDATSAYEYLEKRFNFMTRIFASGCFTLYHIFRMGVVMALAAQALAVITPLEPWQCVLVMGVLCLIYCTLGGIEAVVWTDTIQTFILMGGAMLCLYLAFKGADNTSLSEATSYGKTKMVEWDFGASSFTTMALWVVIVGAAGQNLASYTADQAVVQRYMTTPKHKDAARAIWLNAWMGIPAAVIFYGMGLAFWMFYRSHPEQLDPTFTTDRIMPLFISQELPIGIAGLLVAGIFAAAQSTVSTSMNSAATTLVTDFLRPFNLCKSERSYFRAAQGLTLTWGVLGTLAGLLFIAPDIKSLFDEFITILGMFLGVLGGVFVLGVLTRRGNGTGAMAGAVSSFALMITIFFTRADNQISGYLYASIAITSCVVIGYIVSLMTASEDKGLAGLTIYSMKSDPALDREAADA